MRWFDWSAWALDAPTLAVLVWIAWFAGWEAYALLSGDYLATWTAHLRPLFISHPWTFPVGVLIWIWLGAHFLFPYAEIEFWRWVFQRG